MRVDKTIIGYVERDEGYYPFYEPIPGGIVTSANIHCKYCSHHVLHYGGPRHDIVCLSCYDKGIVDAVEEAEYKKAITLKDKLDAYRDMVRFIANDYHELSHDKIAWQRDDWKKRCKKLLWDLENDD